MRGKDRRVLFKACAEVCILQIDNPDRVRENVQVCVRSDCFLQNAGRQASSSCPACGATGSWCGAAMKSLGASTWPGSTPASSKL